MERSRRRVKLDCTRQDPSNDIIVSHNTRKQREDNDTEKEETSGSQFDRIRRGILKNANNYLRVIINFLTLSRSLSLPIRT